LCTPVGRNISLGLEWWRDKVNAAGGIKTQNGTCNALSENTSMGRNGPQNGHQNGLWNARNARNGQSMSMSWPGFFFFPCMSFQVTSPDSPGIYLKVELIWKNTTQNGEPNNQIARAEAHLDGLSCISMHKYA